MTEEAEEWLLREKRSVAAMNERQLSRSSMEIRQILGVSLTGREAGSILQLYLKDGKRRYELDDDCTQEDLNEIFQGVERFTPPKLKKGQQDWRLEKQDPASRKVLWFLGGTVNFAGGVSSILAMNAGYRFPWINILCLFCLLSALALYGGFPAYFTIFEGKRSSDKTKSSAFGLYLLPLICPLGLLCAVFKHAAVLAWWKSWVIGAVLVIGLAVLLWKRSPEIRTPARIVSFILIGTLISCGPVHAVNFLLDYAPVQEIRTDVLETSKSNSSKGGETYYINLQVDGRELEIPVSYEIYTQTQPGDRVTVEIHSGALGIPYAVIEDPKE